MASTNEFTVSCREMGSHEANVLYKGAICRAGALALESQLESLFGYFQYRRITLSLESPGGAIDGLDYVLRLMKKWARQGRVVAVESTFVCASAAAFLLAMGEWGRRSVDRSTMLLFHSSRIEAPAMLGMTAAISSNLSSTLQSVDRRLLEMLVNKMLLESGSNQDLVELVLGRMHFVEQNWMQLAGDLSTLTAGADGSRKPDWLKGLQKWTRHGADPKRFVAEMKKYLSLRLQQDSRMDLCEAYVLCLIDQIDGVVDADSVTHAPLPAAVAQDHFPDQPRVEGAQQRPGVDRPQPAMKLRGPLATKQTGWLW
ncbi:MAG: ATP-dependent Clp protease proteolytic subunit [Rhodoferax sp.]